MASSKKNLGAALVGIGFAVAFFFPYDKIKKPEEIKTAIVVPLDKKAETTKDKTQTGVGSPASSSSDSSQQGVVAIQKKRDEYNSIILNRLRELKTDDQGSNIVFSIATKAEAKSCQTGDFDIIKSLVNDGTDKVFLLSVEKLRGKGEKAIATRLNLFDIMKGEAHAFAMPKLEDAQEYGVYLCLDPNKTNSCNQKPALATKDWNTVLNQSKLPANILYFQLMTTRASKAYLIPIDKWGTTALIEMKEKLKPWLKSPSESLEQTASIMSKLGSLPAGVDGGILQIPLPYRDPRCDSKASIKGSGKVGGG